MNLTITIRCDNAAFANDDGNGSAMGPECARILNRLAVLLSREDSPADGWAQPLQDVNGNTMGRAMFHKEGVAIVRSRVPR